MSYEIVAIPNFRKELKLLAGKYPSIKDDLSKLLDSLVHTPAQGTPLGNNCYKIRLAIKSKGKGKSAGARLITYIKIIDQKVFLLSIYDKSTTDTISKKELELLLRNISG